MTQQRWRRLAALALLTAPAAADACRCAERTLTAYFNAANSVRIAVVESVTAGDTETAVHVTLVDDAYKGEGEVGDALTYLTGSSSAACGVIAPPSSVLVLFSTVRTDGRERVDTCSGTRPLRLPADGRPRGFIDVPTRFVVQQLTALAGLAMLRDIAAAAPRPDDPHNTALVGLLDIESLAHGGDVAVHAEPAVESPLLARISRIEALETREAGYELAAAAVYGRSSFGYRVQLTDGRFGWIDEAHGGTWFDYAKLPVSRLSYLTSSWPGFLWPEPGAGLPMRTRARRAETPVNVLQHTRVGGSLWFYVERLSTSPCDSSAATPLERGWVPAYGADGQPTVWFYSRGC